MWGSVSALKTIAHGGVEPGPGAVDRPGTCGEVPVKSEMNSPSATVTLTLQ